MSTIGAAVRQARKGRRWSCGKLAEKAGELSGAPEISELQIRALEKGRNTFRIDDPNEPLPWVLRALDLGVEVIAKGLGMERGAA
jgi:transcriptional regulator with XRE-family HTH domain